MKSLLVLLVCLLAGAGAGTLFVLHRATPEPTSPAIVRNGDLRDHFDGVDADLVLYSLPDCRQSASARAFLSRHAIPFEERDVGESLPAREQARALGATSVPVLAVRGGTYIEGFDVDQLSQILRRHSLLPGE